MVSLRVWLERYLKSLERDNASPYTIKNYGTDIGQFLDYCDDHRCRTLDALSRDLVRDYLTKLNDDDYVKASIARCVFELRAFGDYLLRSKAWEQNLFRRIYAPRVPQRLPRYLSYEEISRLLAVTDTSSVQGLRNHAILETLYASGIRVSELVGLNLKDVNFAAHELRVVGKGNKERITILGQPAIAALQAYLKRGRTELVGKQSTQALFLNRFGGRLSVRSVSTVVHQAGVAAGIEQKVTPHLLRHTFATHLLDGGADLRVVQELLGHENLATTQIYANVTQRRAREIYLKTHPRSQEHQQHDEYAGR